MKKLAIKMADLLKKCHRPSGYKECGTLNFFVFNPLSFYSTKVKFHNVF